MCIFALTQAATDTLITLKGGLQKGARMAYRVVLAALFSVFALAATAAVITTTKQVHDHKAASIERGRN